MSNKNTLLISMLITAAVIGFVETGVVQIVKSRLYAVQEKTALILKKGDKIVEIQPGDKIFINDGMITYRSLDKVNKLILVAGSNYERSLGFDEIITISIPAGTKAKEYGKKSFQYGGLAGAIIGAAITFPNDLNYMVVLVPMCAGFDGSVLGIAGAAYGYTQKTGGQPYKLGSGEWEIANE